MKSKEYITLTIEFESDTPWRDVVRDLVSRIGNLSNNELDYTITNVYKSPFRFGQMYDEDEDWYDD